MSGQGIFKSRGSGRALTCLDLTRENPWLPFKRALKPLPILVPSDLSPKQVSKCEGVKRHETFQPKSAASIVARVDY